jgi:hypothetical protein
MTTYPQPVLDNVNSILETCEESELFSDSEVEVNKSILENLLLESALDKFLHNDGVFVWYEDEMEVIISEAIIYTAINNLRENGLVDSIEDENGEEVFWATEEGKKLIGKRNS